jgi:tetratricopeptide (TPR) repeat protein
MNEVMTDANAPSSEKRLPRMLGWLEADPENLTLLEDTAETALAEGDPQAALDLADRYAALAPLPPALANLAGLAAMEQRRFDEAGQRFQAMVDAGNYDPALSFNLAWCRAMAKDFDGAMELLSDDVTRAIPAAAMLHVQILHDREELEEAVERGRAYMEMHPNHAPLMAAVSVVAIDAEDEALAGEAARRGGQHPDAQTTLGTLALGDDRPEEAMALFEQALARSDTLPRALLGRGLAQLSLGKTAQAAKDLDRGAELFEDHLGSWIAAGWAYFVQQDLDKARERFEHALALDDTFAESHGSLAVVELLQGDAESAQRRTEVALRLDRNCFSAALASSLLAAGGGDQDKARRIFELATNTPLDASGRTIAQLLAKRGAGLG